MASPVWLSRFIAEVRVDDWASPHPITLLPHGRTRLILRVHDGQRSGDLTVSGPRSRALFKTSTGVARAITVELKPGWSLPLLGVAPGALIDRFVKLDDLWGSAGTRLCTEMLEARSVPEIVDRLSRAIADKATRASLEESASARIARRAARLLDGDELRVEHVARQLGITSRHLRRVFVDTIGIGPKDYARVVRLQRATQEITSSPGTTDWGRIASDAGYYDQSHLTAEFRELIGVTPGELAKHYLTTISATNSVSR